MKSPHKRIKPEIKIDRFKDYEINWWSFSNFWASNVNFLQPKSIYLITCILLLLISIFNIDAFKIGIPLLLIYFYQFKKLETLENHFKLRRIHPDKGKEEEHIEVQYHISNPTNFEFYNFNLFDVFDGHENNRGHNHWLLSLDQLPRNTRKKTTRNIDLNYGMGEKSFGPLGLLMTDELGVHRLTYQENKNIVFQVFPKVYPSKPHRIQPNPHSRHFGNFDTYQRGENVNFFGVREYQQGDNVKKINWKLSLKSNQIIVNEYEKNVNGKICIVFINDNRIHSGEGAQSSFEYIKDLTLSICHHHIKNNNELALISHSQFTPYNSGSAHVQGIELLMGRIQLEQYNMNQFYHRGAKTPDEIIRLKKKVSLEIDPQTHLYVLTGFLPGKMFNYYSEAIKIWSKNALSTHLLAVNAITQQTRDAQNSDEASSYSAILSKMGPEKTKLINQLKNHNIKIQFINVDRHIPYKDIIQQGINIK